jgi:hypothetical protein
MWLVRLTGLFFNWSVGWNGSGSGDNQERRFGCGRNRPLQCLDVHGGYGGGGFGRQLVRVASHGYSVANGFTWEGNVVAPGFSCTLAGKKFRFTSGSGGTFTIAGASPGRYALVVFLSNQTARLVLGTNGALLTIDLPSEQGVGVGSITVSQ